MKENKFTAWVKSHKTELLIIGGVVVTTIGAILLLDNFDGTNDLISSDENTVSYPPLEVMNEMPAISVVESDPIFKIGDVRQHLRNLPYGYHPSVEKIAEAAELGIELAEHQTIVTSHPRCYAA